MSAGIVSLDDVRNHLRMPATYTQDDNMLLNIFIPAAGDVIRNECGDIVSTIYDEFYDGGDYSIWLYHKPILSVQLVEEGWGFTNYDLDFVEVNAETTADMFAYSIDSPLMGLISRRSGGNVNIPFMHGSSNIHVIYSAGRQTTPPAVYLAALELVAEWYQNTQQREIGTADAYQAIDTNMPRSGADIYTPMTFGVPDRILELLKPYKRPPIIG
jgi:hypothetical protein